MKEGQWDYITDELKDSMKYVRGMIKEDFKNIKPYRKEPVPIEEQVARYISYPEEVKTQMRQIPQWNEYESKILKRMEGMKNGR
jgi:hypothetical protein